MTFVDLETLYDYWKLDGTDGVLSYTTWTDEYNKVHYVLNPFRGHESARLYIRYEAKNGRHDTVVFANLHIHEAKKTLYVSDVVYSYESKNRKIVGKRKAWMRDDRFEDMRACILVGFFSPAWNMHMRCNRYHLVRIVKRHLKLKMSSIKELAWLMKPLPPIDDIAKIKMTYNAGMIICCGGGVRYDYLDIAYVNPEKFMLY